MKNIFKKAVGTAHNVASSRWIEQTKDLVTHNDEIKFNARSSPSIKLATIREGKSPSILVINGFLSQSSDEVSDWLAVVDELYPKNKVIHVQWNAGNLSQMVLDDGIMPSETSGDKGVNKILAAVKLARGMAPAAIAAIAGGVVFDKVIGHWKKSFQETEHVGADLANAIQNDESLHGAILMGHSLGARVIRHTLNNLEANKVSGCYLLAGAVSSEKDQWASILEKHTDLRLINCYSDNDYTLKSAYRVGTLLDHTPAGLANIESDDAMQVMNLDVTEFASGHMNYKHEKVGKALAGTLNPLTFNEKAKLALRF